MLVVGVIFLFLHNGSATLIPALALPFSIFGTFAVMQLLGFSLNNLSMMALILSHRLRRGRRDRDAREHRAPHRGAARIGSTASLNGSKEIGFTILTMTTSLAAVFIPILFMSGILGRLFREFAVTITAAILVSGLVSITLTPMLCSRFLRVVHTKTRARGLARSRVRRAVRRLPLEPRRRAAPPRGDARRRSSSCWPRPSSMYGVVPKGFIPDQDNDSMNINIRAAQGTSFYEMADGGAAGRRGRPAEPVHRQLHGPDVGGGSGYGGSQNTAQVQVNLVPRATRPLSAQQISQQLRRQLLSFPELQRVREPAVVAADRRARRQQLVQRHRPERRTPTSSTRRRAS